MSWVHDTNIWLLIFAAVGISIVVLFIFQLSVMGVEWIYFRAMDHKRRIRMRRLIKKGGRGDKEV